MNNFVTVKTAGGLGNILFQVATGYSYAKRTNKDFILFLTELNVVVVDSNQPSEPSDFLNGKSIPIKTFSSLSLINGFIF